MQYTLTNSALNYSLLLPHSYMATALPVQLAQYSHCPWPLPWPGYLLLTMVIL